jgi:minor extracellular serine protease Vpr
VYPPEGYYGALKALGYPWAVSGDVRMTVSDIGCTPSAVTVAAYTTKTGFLNINHVSLSYPGGVFGRLAPFSSFGPTRDNRVKPDISAPGFALASSISSYDTSYLSTGTNYLGVVSASTIAGHTYAYAMAAGTSMASPCVSGIVAMMLQLDPTLTPDMVKSMIALNAITDTYTGTIPAGGNTSWGNGKINAYKTLKYLAQVVSVENTLTPNPLDCLLYPNPSKGTFTIDYVSKGTDKLTITIADMTGRVISTQNWFVNTGSNSRQFSIPALAKGIYFTKISSGSKYNVIKTVVE